ncbi:hypothetical protein TNCV_4289311 [Trichonephila clavipes]|nr:hypothetical protein TNCV_4289311 [Trichonephila clavipes]
MPTSAIKDLLKKWDAVRAMVLEWHPNQADVSRFVKFILEAASSNTSLIKSSDFDKPAALATFWKIEYLVPFIVNKPSYDTAPFLLRNDSSQGNRCDIFLRVFNNVLSQPYWRQYMKRST